MGVVTGRGGNLLNGLLGGNRDVVACMDLKIFPEEEEEGGGFESVVVVVVGLMEPKILLLKDDGFEDESKVFDDVLGASKVEENRNVEVCGGNDGAIIPPNNPPPLAPALVPVVAAVVPPFTPFYCQLVLHRGIHSVRSLRYWQIYSVEVLPFYFVNLWIRERERVYFRVAMTSWDALFTGSILSRSFSSFCSSTRGLREGSLVR